MSTTPRPLPTLILSAAAALLLAAPAWPATPIFGCTASLVFVATQDEPQPIEHEIDMAVTRLPDFIPRVTSLPGRDYCVNFRRTSLDDEINPPIQAGSVSMTAYRLNPRGKWRRLARVTEIPVVDGAAMGCRNSRKRVHAGDVLRWVVRFHDLPDLVAYDLYEIDTWLLTGGAGVAIEGAATGSPLSGLLGSRSGS